MKIAALSLALSVAIVLAVPFTPIAATEPTAPTPSTVEPTAPRITLPVGPLTAVRVQAAQASAVTVPKVTIMQAPAPLNVGQSRHSAFPGLAKLPNGDLRLVWREGTDHANTRDGMIMRATSRDGGATYQDVLALRTGADYRDPSVSVVNGAEYLTWFTGTNAAPAQGAWAMREWGSAVRFDGGLSYAATTAPLVRLPNGQIGGAFYGRKPGEGVDTAFMAWSADGGGMWTNNRIANSIGAGVAHNEPFVVVDGALTHFFYRYGGSGLAVRTSTNSGLPLASGGTGWDSARQVLTNATGRPSTVLAADGTLIMVYREASTGAARIAYSTDHAQTFQVGPVLLASKGGLGMTYAAMYADGVGIYGVVGMEDSGGAASKLYGFRLATAP